ncbi:MAG: outer membrane beta-barrel protein [Lentimicrobiaceae bacterium]|nr:outer membrane beta-barrel protein [Lentimicrobiaceae bacterium]
MKTQLRITAMLILGFVSISSYAQVEKGNWFIGGTANIEFNSDKEKVKSGGNTRDYATYSDFDFRPYVGYFIIDRLPIGLIMDISLDKIKYEDGGEYTDNEYILGPFVRYYVADFDGFMPFAELSFGFGGGKTTSEYMGNENENKYSSLNFKVGVGTTYFVTPNVGFDMFIGYRRNQNTFEIDENVRSSSEDVTYSYGGLDFNLGIVVSLGGK